MGYLANGPVHAGLIEIEHLTMVVLYEESLTPQYSALALAGFAARRIPWGIRLGGPGQCRFCKDLRLQPVPGRTATAWTSTIRNSSRWALP